MPGVSPTCRYSQRSSSRSCSLRWASFSVLVGRARIHLRMTVQILGVGFKGVKPSICSTDARLSLVMPSMICPSTPMPRVTADIGSVACHSANFLATPLYTSGRRRSAGDDTFPSMKRYMSPLLNLARSGGASLWLASREWEAHSPAETWPVSSDVPPVEIHISTHGLCQ